MSDVEWSSVTLLYVNVLLIVVTGVLLPSLYILIATLSDDVIISLSSPYYDCIKQ